LPEGNILDWKLFNWVARRLQHSSRNILNKPHRFESKVFSKFACVAP